MSGANASTATTEDAAADRTAFGGPSYQGLIASAMRWPSRGRCTAEI